MTPAQLQAYLNWKHAVFPPGTLGDAFFGGPPVTAPSPEPFSPLSFGADPTGTFDSTTALQACFDAAFAAQTEVFISGTYLFTTLVVYPGMTLRWGAASILRKTADGPGIHTVIAPGDTYAKVGTNPAQGNILGITFDKPVIDINGHHGPGIMLECCRDCWIMQPTIYGGSTSGTWTYTDAHQSGGTYPDCMVAIKGTYNVDICTGCGIVGGSIYGASGTLPAAGVWIGATSGDTTAHNCPNANIFSKLLIPYCAIGIQLDYGNDNIFEGVDVSLCTRGIQLGDPNHTYRTVSGNELRHTYAENNTLSIYLASQTSINYIINLASTAGSTTVIQDLGSNNVLVNGPNRAFTNHSTISFQSELAVGSGGANPSPPPSASYCLQVDAPDSQNAIIEADSWSGPALFRGVRHGGTHASPGQTPNTNLAGFTGSGLEADGTTFARDIAGVYIESTESIASGHFGAEVVIQTTPTASTTTANSAIFYGGGGFATAGPVAFNGLGSPPAQATVTGSRGSNAALASLLTILAATGLLVDGSS